MTVASGIQDSRLTVHNDEAAIRLTMVSDAGETVLTGGVIAQFNIRPSDLKAITNEDALRERILAHMADGNAEMDVELVGIAPVAIRPRGGLVDKLMEIPEGLEHCFAAILEQIISPLEPYVREHGRVV